MANLISKDETIKGSTVYIGFLILKELKKKEENKISIYELIERLRKKQGLVHYRQALFSLMFLYASGVISFKEPYICKI